MVTDSCLRLKPPSARTHYDQARPYCNTSSPLLLMSALVWCYANCNLMPPSLINFLRYLYTCCACVHITCCALWLNFVTYANFLLCRCHEWLLLCSRLRSLAWMRWHTLCHKKYLPSSYMRVGARGKFTVTSWLRWLHVESASLICSCIPHWHDQEMTKSPPSLPACNGHIGLLQKHKSKTFAVSLLALSRLWLV
jgi:hypothetical protein